MLGYYMYSDIHCMWTELYDRNNIKQIIESLSNSDNWILDPILHVVDVETSHVETKNVSFTGEDFVRTTNRSYSRRVDNVSDTFQESKLSVSNIEEVSSAILSIQTIDVIYNLEDFVY